MDDDTSEAPANVLSALISPNQTKNNPKKKITPFQSNLLENLKKISRTDIKSRHEHYKVFSSLH